MLIKEYTLRVSEELEELVTTVVQKLGAEVEPMESLVEKKSVTRPKKSSKKVDADISPTYLFGAWKDFDIDPDKLRDEAWGRNLKY